MNCIKIQRPSIESKLMGDVANLKAITKTFRDTPTLPLDYYTVFSELETQLQDEFDFVAEAAAMDRIYNALRMSPDGRPRDIPLVLPRPVPGLVSQRVLVQDFLHGVPLSRASEKMAARGIDPDSAEAKLFGRQLLSALTTCFGRSILETGFFHAGKGCVFFHGMVTLWFIMAFFRSPYTRFVHQQTRTQGTFSYWKMDALASLTLVR